MATITLDTVWLNLASDLTSFCAMEHVTDINPAPEVDVDVRAYAGGRLRMVSGPRRQQVVSVSAGFVRRADVRWLEAASGLLLLYRDPQGRKFYGVFADLQVSERKLEDAADVSFTVRQVTRSEVV